MTVDYETRLCWIQKNRYRPSRVRSVSRLMSRLADSLGDRAWAVVRDAATSLAEHVDEDFRKHCRLTLAAGGQLVVHVDHGSLIYSMRTKWTTTLTRVLVNGDGFRDVRSIQFRYGLDGITVGLSASD